LEPTCTVITAYNGTEALDAITDEVDVVLLDRRMPGLAGEEVLEAIREAEYDCRVAMVTAVTPEEDIVEMGFDDYLAKPVDRKRLLETVDRPVELSAYDDLVQEHYPVSYTHLTLPTSPYAQLPVVAVPL
jgi:DNA-binding response OmpR family regulator